MATLNNCFMNVVEGLGFSIECSRMDDVDFKNMPEKFNEYLRLVGQIDIIYKAMEAKDKAVVAMRALQVLLDTEMMPKINKKNKCDETSDLYRSEGNKTYVNGSYLKTLKLYNRALTNATKNSLSMKLAYSNRSALFFQAKHYVACLKDIETCLSMKCSREITEKLKKRKEECMQLIDNENPMNMIKMFQIDGQRNPNIPCASTDVEVVIKNQLPKVVAAKNIKVGTVVAVETAFVTVVDPCNHYIACYHCNRLSLNLIPCDGCCYVLFCDETCKENCMKDFHSVECQIIEVLQEYLCDDTLPKLVLKSVLKIKSRCESWSEFITSSYVIGEERMKKNSIRDIYDSSAKFSMLNFAELREMKQGAMYNAAFMCATFIFFLNRNQYFPIKFANETKVAMEAFARVTMHLFLKFFNRTLLKNTASLSSNVITLNHIKPNYGYFSFAGKLRHACEANLIRVALNNRMALVAVQPIKKGMELTLSYIDHVYETEESLDIKKRALKLYGYSVICDCGVCTGTWRSVPEQKLNAEQLSFYHKWLSHMAPGLTVTGLDGFKLTCQGLTILHGKTRTEEFKQMFTLFRELLRAYQFAETKNFLCSE